MSAAYTAQEGKNRSEQIRNNNRFRQSSTKKNTITYEKTTTRITITNCCCSNTEGSKSKPNQNQSSTVGYARVSVVVEKRNFDGPNQIRTRMLLVVGKLLAYMRIQR